jgi:type IV pilus assembly protein PilA
MGFAQGIRRGARNWIWCGAALGLIFVVVSNCTAQTQSPDQSAEVQALEKLGLTPPVLEELSKLIEKFQRTAQYPPARSESRLMALEPDSTVAYVAISNYGEVANQGLQIFRQELKESAVLRDWWQQGSMAATGPMLEVAVEKFSEFSGYLGNEIAIAGSVEGRDPELLIAAEVRKPGLKEFLAQILKQYGGPSTPVRILDAKEFAEAKETGAGKNLNVLVRPDYMIASLDLAALRSFNARLDQKHPGFSSTPFGQPIAQAYQGRVTILEAVDIQKILTLLPITTEKDKRMLEQTGLADLKYWISRRLSVEGKQVSEGEVSFTRPRRGVMAWLAPPAALGSLDFISPSPVAVASLKLKNPAEIYDDVRALSTASNPNSFAMVDAFEHSLNISVRNDVLGQLGGEITGELVSYLPQQAVWRAVLSVKDSAKLQQSLNTLLSAVTGPPAKSEADGITYYTLKIPSSKPPAEVDYAFVGGYLIAGSSQKVVAEAVRLHKNGGGLAKTERFRAALPPGHGSEFSSLIYEDPLAVVALNARKTAPELTQLFGRLSGQEPPVVACGYGEEKTIRAVSTSPAIDASVVLIGAAIAIPNLLRSRVAANEASAVGSLRTVNTAQVTYGSIYPEKGFAPNLATLGEDPSGSVKGPARHANLVSAPLGDPSCVGTKWCTKSGYQFRLRGVCDEHGCTDYVVVAAPVASDTGNRTFCSTSDGVIYYKAGAFPQDSKLTVKECQAWTPLQ